MGSPPAPRLAATGLTKRYGGVTVLDDVAITLQPGGTGAARRERSRQVDADQDPLRRGGQRRDDRARRRTGDDRRAARRRRRRDRDPPPGARSCRGSRSPRTCSSVVACRRARSDRPEAAASRRRGAVRRARLQHGRRPPRRLVEPRRSHDDSLARALALDSRVLILDEPTAALADAEARTLFATIGRLRDQGVAILYVSHRLEEVVELCDTYTVLRATAGSSPTAGLPRPRSTR